MSLPEALFSKDTGDRAASFAACTADHKILCDLRALLLAEILHGVEPCILALLGPTGVGKTTLADTICADIAGFFDPAAERPDRMPYIRVTAVTPHQGNYRWPDFNRRVLIAGNEPLVDKKVVVEKKLSKQPYSRTDTADALRLSAENMLRHRNPYVLVIDEAQSITKVVSGRRFLDQAEILKDLCNVTGVKILLVGTPDLLQIAMPNGQLSRRMNIWFFPNYKAERQQDMAEFVGALQYFQDSLPLEGKSDLVPYWKDLYGLSLGLIGVLKKMLAKALMEALVLGRKSLDYKMVEKHAMSDKRRDQIIDEIRQCDKAMKEDAKKTPAGSAVGLNAPFHEDDEGECIEPKRGTKKPGKVGKRKPARDHVPTEDEVTTGM